MGNISSLSFPVSLLKFSLYPSAFMYQIQNSVLQMKTSSFSLWLCFNVFSSTEEQCREDSIHPWIMKLMRGTHSELKLDGQDAVAEPWTLRYPRLDRVSLLPSLPPIAGSEAHSFPGHVQWFQVGTFTALRFQRIKGHQMLRKMHLSW